MRVSVTSPTYTLQAEPQGFPDRDHAQNVGFVVPIHTPAEVVEASCAVANQTVCSSCLQQKRKQVLSPVGGQQTNKQAAQYSRLLQHPDTPEPSLQTLPVHVQEANTHERHLLCQPSRERHHHGCCTPRQSREVVTLHAAVGMLSAQTWKALFNASVRPQLQHTHQTELCMRPCRCRAAACSRQLQPGTGTPDSRAAATLAD